MDYESNLKYLQEYCALNTESTASLLIAFFEYYTTYFDVCQEVVSIRVPPAYRMTKNEKDDRCGWKLHGRFCIEDPFDVSLDLAQVVNKQSVGSCHACSKCNRCLDRNTISRTFLVVCYFFVLVVGEAHRNDTDSR